MRGSEDAILYVLLGGPYDGANREADVWENPPEFLWARPGGEAKYGLLVTDSPREGAERYVLSALQPGEAFYQHWTVGMSVGPFIHVLAGTDA